MQQKTIPDKKPIISLCIPTNGVKEWVIPVVESIYSQDIDDSLFEIVISDNGCNPDLEKALSSFSHSNLSYHRSDYKGFTNQIDCLKRGRGLYRKMLNHRSCILPGTLSKMIGLVLNNQDTRPVLYFSDGKISTGEETVLKCDTFDVFLSNLHYWISWSAGVGLWDTDCEKLDEINPNKLFPHISLIFDTRTESKCIIWNEPYQKMLNDDGKGGYNLFYTFSVTLLDLLNNYVDSGIISKITYQKTKHKLFGFLRELYISEVILPTKHSFELSGIKKSISTHYSTLGYIKLVSTAYIKLLENTVIKLFRHID